MNKYLLVSLVFILFPIFIFAQHFQFQTHEIGRHGTLIGQTSLVDIDKDGDLDWVYGLRGEMFWYEFQNADRWIQHKMGSGAKTDVGGCPIDINHDGWVDYMAGTGWYQNTGSPLEESFVLHDNIGTISCHDNIAVDIDGDSILDIVAVSNDKDQELLMWYKTDTISNKKWKSTMIGEGIHGGIGPKGFGDLDNDGDMDIVRGNFWFENVDGKGCEWKEHTTLIPNEGNRPGKYGLALKTWVVDMDNDGDLDVVESEADTENGRIFWFESQEKGQKWIYHNISNEQTGQDFHSLALADFDNDGDLDVFSGGGPLSAEPIKMFIWENVKGDASEWEEHVLLEGKRCHEAVAADVDGDGDIDICTKPWKGDGLHLYLENKLIQSSNQFVFFDDVLTQDSTGVPALNRMGPKNLKSPVDYTQGNLFMKLEILEKPSDMNFRPAFFIWQDMDKHPEIGHMGARRGSIADYKNKGVYYVNYNNPSQWWHGDFSVPDWSRPFDKIALVPWTGDKQEQLYTMECWSHCYKGGDISRHTPIVYRATGIWVAPGEKLNPPSDWNIPKEWSSK